MNDEILTSPANVIWQHYEFAFDDKSCVNDQLFDTIRKKITDLKLPNSDAEIKYKIAKGMPLVVDVYIREQVHMDEVKSLLQPAEKLVFKKSTETAATVDSSGSGSTRASSLLADSFEDDGPEIETITNRGAIKDPPKTSDPLP